MLAWSLNTTGLDTVNAAFEEAMISLSNGERSKNKLLPKKKIFMRSEAIRIVTIQKNGFCFGFFLDFWLCSVEWASFLDS
jgi:hypothetical protein